MGNVLGTSFAQSGFSYDANLSPWNQSFSYAVLAVVRAAASTITVGTASSLVGTAAFANPSVKASTTATNGTSTLAMRSDAAPAVDVAAAYSWTGTNTFVGASAPGNAITVLTVATSSGPSNGIKVLGTAAGTAQKTWGLVVISTNTNAGAAIQAGISLVAGTAVQGTGDFIIYQGGDGNAYVINNNNNPLNFYTGTAVTQMLTISGTTAASGALIKAYGPAAAGLVDMTPDAVTGTMTSLAGLTTQPTTTWSFRRVGNVVVAVSGNTVVGSGSSTTNFQLSPIPAAFIPSTSQVGLIPSGVFEDNGARVTQNILTVTNTGTLSFSKGDGAALVGGPNRGLASANFAAMWVLA